MSYLLQKQNNINFDLYMKEILKYNLLTKDEEHSLAIRFFENNDLEAIKKLIKSNLRLVVKIAFDYKKYWFNILDLIQEGNIGLMQGAKKYNPYKNTKFSYYVSYWIKANILAFIMDNWSSVKIATTQLHRRLFFQLKKAKAQIFATGEEITAEKLAKKLKCKTSDITDMDERLKCGDSSLNRPISQEENSICLIDNLIDTKTKSIDNQLIKQELLTIFKNKLKMFKRQLNERELLIFEKRLISHEPITLQELGNTFGVSKERARQLTDKLLNKLKKYILKHAPELQFNS